MAITLYPEIPSSRALYTLEEVINLLLVSIMVAINNQQSPHVYSALLTVRSRKDGHKRRIVFKLETNWTVALTNRELAVAMASGEVPYEDEVNTLESAIEEFFLTEPWDVLKCEYVRTPAQAKEADKLEKQRRIVGTVLYVDELPV